MDEPRTSTPRRSTTLAWVLYGVGAILWTASLLGLYLLDIRQFLILQPLAVMAMVIARRLHDSATGYDQDPHNPYRASRRIPWLERACYVVFAGVMVYLILVAW